MKRFKLKILIVLFVCFLSGNNQLLKASLINPIIEETSIKSQKISLSYKDYHRPTVFFHGYKKNIYFKNIFLNLAYKTAKNMEYSINIGKGAVYLDGRKTNKYGYEVRLGLSSDIWGDLIVLPLWKWHIDIARGEYDFKEYLKNRIDIKYNFTACNLGLFVTKKFGIFVPYSGLSFYYLLDSYKEKTTGLSKSSGTSGLVPFCGIKFQLFNNFSAQFESEFNDEKGFSFSLSKVL
jgi:hypothetical protein